MSKTKFEKLGIPYEERDGIFYPVLVAGTEKADIDVGKYSDIDKLQSSLDDIKKTFGEVLGIWRLQRS